MGLGKTVQTIAYLLSEPSDKPHLVVVPSSVIYNWQNECERFAPTLKVEVIAGTPVERQQIVKDGENADVWFTYYGSIILDIGLYRDLIINTFYLDVVQLIIYYI